jgi:hypothetical protein
LLFLLFRNWKNDAFSGTQNKLIMPSNCCEKYEVASNQSLFLKGATYLGGVLNGQR